MDVLSSCCPGWDLKGASVFPKWNTLCSISHFFMSGKKKSTISKLALNAFLFHADLGRIRKLLSAAVTIETPLP